MSSAELRKKFLEFFSAKGGPASGGEHKIVPSSSLIPDDPSVLLTTAGMQQFKKYYTEPSLAPAKNVASVQKCFRTSDIDEVGDESHLTFFEMLGHFSFGDYFKKETIGWTYELLTEVFRIEPGRISATVFAGDEKIPFDKESYDAWSKFLPQDRIRKGPRADNVWGPAGPEGPCGAANEVYVDNLEVATLVFMEYYCAKDGSLTPLPQKGVDVGWGFERLAMIIQGKKNIFETDLFEFAPLLKGGDEEITRRARIIADHLRGSVFLLADGVRPSNKEAGYVLRRLLRRLLMQWKELSLSSDRLEERLKKVIDKYSDFYPELKNMQDKILYEFKIEDDKFSQTLEKGKKEFYKQYPKIDVKTPGLAQYHKIKRIFGRDAFYFYQTFGLTLENVKDLARDGGHIFDESEEMEFNLEFKKHQEISRAGQEKKFGGHGLLLDTGELKAKDEEELKKVTRLHTATHLLQAALRKVLGPEVRQMGSDITAERTRFDFTFGRKLTPEEIKKVEDSVNDAVSQELEVSMQEMDFEEAQKTGALHFFREKYPPKVKVYTVFPFSREICGGPHVKNTSEVGKFAIVKEEAVASGVRRIRAKVFD